MSDEQAVDDADADHDAHLRDVPDGAGCTEIWERAGESREQVSAD